MGIHYLTFMGRNLEYKKKLMLVQIMNNAGMNSMNNNVMNSMNIVSSGGIFGDNATMNDSFNE